MTIQHGYVVLGSDQFAGKPLLLITDGQENGLEALFAAPTDLTTLTTISPYKVYVDGLADPSTALKAKHLERIGGGDPYKANLWFSPTGDVGLTVGPATPLSTFGYERCTMRNNSLPGSVTDEVRSIYETLAGPIYKELQRLLPPSGGIYGADFLTRVRKMFSDFWGPVIDTLDDFDFGSGYFPLAIIFHDVSIVPYHKFYVLTRQPDIIAITINQDTPNTDQTVWTNASIISWGTTSWSFWYASTALPAIVLNEYLAILDKMQDGWIAWGVTKGVDYWNGLRAIAPSLKATPFVLGTLEADLTTLAATNLFPTGLSGATFYGYQMETIVLPWALLVRGEALVGAGFDLRGATIVVDDLDITVTLDPNHRSVVYTTAARITEALEVGLDPARDQATRTETQLRIDELDAMPDMRFTCSFAPPIPALTWDQLLTTTGYSTFSSVLNDVVADGNSIDEVKNAVLYLARNGWYPRVTRSTYPSADTDGLAAAMRNPSSYRIQMRKGTVTNGVPTYNAGLPDLLEIVNFNNGSEIYWPWTSTLSTSDRYDLAILVLGYGVPLTLEAAESTSVLIARTTYWTGFTSVLAWGDAELAAGRDWPALVRETDIRALNMSNRHALHLSAQVNHRLRVALGYALVDKTLKNVEALMPLLLRSSREGLQQ